MAVLDLKPRQRRTIAALLSSRSVPEAAKIATVGERTLYRWLTEPEFRAALLEAESDAINAATRRLIDLQGRAIDALSDVFDDGEASHNEKMRAAQTVLEYLLKLRELQDVEQRLAELERMVYEHENRQKTDKLPGG